MSLTFKDSTLTGPMDDIVSQRDVFGRSSQEIMEEALFLQMKRLDYASWMGVNGYNRHERARHILRRNDHFAANPVDPQTTLRVLSASTRLLVGEDRRRMSDEGTFIDELHDPAASMHRHMLAHLHFNRDLKPHLDNLFEGLEETPEGDD